LNRLASSYNPVQRPLKKQRHLFEKEVITKIMFKKSKARSASTRMRSSHTSLASSGSEGGLPDAAALARLPIALNLGDYQMVYEGGCWRSGEPIMGGLVPL
jgi:hypothetical protein